MKKTLIISILMLTSLLAGCAKAEPALTDSSSSEQDFSSEMVSSAPVLSDVSSAVSSEVSSLIQASSVPTSSETVTSSSPLSKFSKVESKAPVSSKAPTSSQSKPKSASSQATQSKPTSSEMPLFGELMDEAVIDKIIAEGIAYAESKGMTWYEDFSVEGSGYYNPAFSGEGAEIFKRDLFYNIDQVYDITAKDPDYYDGCLIYYKIVKGEFDEPGYWYGFVLY